MGTDDRRRMDGTPWTASLSASRGASLHPRFRSGDFSRRERSGQLIEDGGLRRMGTDDRRRMDGTPDADGIGDAPESGFRARWMGC
jgi:hypothetical protein